MDMMIFLALLYIAFHLPTEDQVQEIIRLLREMKPDTQTDDYSSRTDDVRPKVTGKPTVNRPTVNRRKR